MSITVSAPAKINLYLHITGRRENGYHDLDSLSTIVDGIADRITIAPAPSLSLTLSGPFAPMIANDAPQSNLAVRAASALAAHLGRRADVAIALEKNIPPGAGLGGGSADAAATVRALLDHWNAIVKEDDLHDLLLSLGSDVPACYAGKPVIIRGTGDIVLPAPPIPRLPVLLIWPGKMSSTPAAYKAYRPPFNNAASVPAHFDGAEDFIAFLSRQQNDLYAPALGAVPEIKDTLDILNAQKNIRLARMSGSGSACFALFDDEESAAGAETAISRSVPSSWWVRRGVLSAPH